VRPAPPAARAPEQGPAQTFAKPAYLYPNLETMTGGALEGVKLPAGWRRPSC